MNRRTACRGLAAALAPLPLLLGACSADEPSATATTPSASASTSTSSSTSATAVPSGFTPIPTDGAGPIPAGTVGLTANGRPDAPWAVLTVPKGWGTIGGWFISDENPGGQAGLSYWTVDNVYRDPCSTADPPPRIPAGSTVESLAAALRQQRQSRVTDPVPVTVDGYRGVSLEVHAPETVDFQKCLEGHYRVWEWSTAGERYMQEPGFDKVYILDVDGTVVVLAVPASDATSKAVLDRVSRMVESVDFVPRT
jgi:hypothetical protein